MAAAPGHESQLDTIAAENPDVVVLQEAYSTQLAYYVNGLNARQNTTAWHGAFNKTCKAGVEPNCTTYTNESVMILTRLKTRGGDAAADLGEGLVSRGARDAADGVALADGTQVNVFVAHLPALVAYAAAARDLCQHLQDLVGVVRRSQGGRRRLQRAARPRRRSSSMTQQLQRRVDGRAAAATAIPT